MTDLPSRLAAAMNAAGFNQPQLARRASSPEAPVSQQVVHQLVSGRNKNSRHLAAIAAALNVNFEWLATGRNRTAGKRKAEALFIGKVGAGDEIIRLSVDPALTGIAPPFGAESPNVLEIEGNHQAPLQNGWLIFYGPERQGISENCLDKLCVVQVEDGTVFLKFLKKDARNGRFRLEGWNTPGRNNMKVVWAARVTDIKPT
jgi:transcriptional regulator with XRE-family HTH domain